jgi:hypothetical protein
MHHPRDGEIFGFGRDFEALGLNFLPLRRGAAARRIGAPEPATMLASQRNGAGSWGVSVDE